MLISDIDRTRLYMRAVISRARSLGQPVPAMIVISVTAWGEWLDNLTEQ